MGQREAQGTGTDSTGLCVRRFFRATGGAAALELAIVAPVALMMLMGAWDFGRALQVSSRLANAAYAGAQYGAQDADHAADAAGIESAALDDAGDRSVGVTVTAARACECPDGVPIACSASCGAAGDPQLYVTVLVESDHETLFPYPFIENPMRLSRQAVMRAR